MRTVFFPLLFGLAGAAVLIWLGTWQVGRLAWKENILNEIETRIASAPVALPDTISEDTHKYLPVEVSGTFAPDTLRVLVSQKKVGAGYRLISSFEVEGRRILVDRGFVRVQSEPPPPPADAVGLTGNLHWPDDRGSSTPENDIAGNTWFARDIAQMAEVLGTEPVLLIARTLSQPEDGVTPIPVDSSGIPNDHLNYAITWFSLAVVWVVMTGYYIFRSRRAEKGKSA